MDDKAINKYRLDQLRMMLMENETMRNYFEQNECDRVLFTNKTPALGHALLDIPEYMKEAVQKIREGCTLRLKERTSETHSYQRKEIELRKRSKK